MNLTNETNMDIVDTKSLVKLPSVSLGVSISLDVSIAHQHLLSASRSPSASPVSISPDVSIDADACHGKHPDISDIFPGGVYTRTNCIRICA